MNCEYCSNGTELSLMNAMCGIEMWTARHSLNRRHWPDCAPTGPNKPARGNAPGLSLPRICFRALKGRNRTICAALSGLGCLLMTITRGVAPSWFVVAPSGRSGARVRLQTLLRGVLFTVAIPLFLVDSPLFAANSPLADAAEKQDRAIIRTLLK